MKTEDIEDQQDLEIEDKPAEKPEEKPAKPAAKGGGKEKDDDKVTLTKAEHAALVRDRDEARDSERYWAEHARKSGKQVPVEEPEEKDDDDEIDEKTDTLVDEFSTKGIQALVSRGMLTKKGAKEMIEKYATRITRQIVGQERQKATTDQRIMSASAFACASSRVAMPSRPCHISLPVTASDALAILAMSLTM